jgi:hypothetical protein
MGLVASGNKVTRELLENGVVQAVCYGLYDVGHQYDEKYAKYVHKCIILWEIPEKRIVIEREGVKKDYPYTLSKKYTVSLNDKSNLKKDLETWRGRAFSEQELVGFDVSSIVGVNCLLQVMITGTDKKYNTITAILPLHKGMTPVEPENKIQSFSIKDNDSIPEAAPEWIKTMIEKSREYSDVEQNDEGPFSW